MIGKLNVTTAIGTERPIYSNGLVETPPSIVTGPLPLI